MHTNSPASPEPSAYHCVTAGLGNPQPDRTGVRQADAVLLEHCSCWQTRLCTLQLARRSWAEGSSTKVQRVAAAVCRARATWPGA